MATAFVGGINPWAKTAMPQIKPTPIKPEEKKMTEKKTKPYGSRVDPSKISIASDPLPAVRLAPNKYWPTFAGMKVGQNIRCKPDEVAPISQALRKYIDVHKITAKGKPVRVISQSNAPDGIGRVWLAEGAPKSQLKAVA